MPYWRPSDRRPPADFINLLYNDDGNLSDEEHLEDMEAMDSEESDVESAEDSGEESDLDEPEAPAYSLHSAHSESSERLPKMEGQPHAHARSRSPLGFSSESAVFLQDGAQPVVLLQMFDENGVSLSMEEPVLEEEFSAPDAHYRFASPEERERDREVRNRDRTRGRRGGGRGVRGVRGQSTRGQSARGGGHPNRSRRVRNGWEVGHPLHEIYVTDDDVPPALKELVRDVMNKRQARVQAAGKARGNTERLNDSGSENEEEFYDADDGGDILPPLERQFEWSPIDSFQGQEEVFQPVRTGSVQDFNSAYDAFRSYWSDDILGLIVNEANQYASKISSPSFQSHWIPTNVHEVLCLFVFWMMLGILRMPTITSCFSLDPLLKTEVFRIIFTRSRYEMLCRALQFLNSDPFTNYPNPSTASAGSLDRLCRLRPIIDHLNSAFQSNYILDKNICIGESLTLWKGRLNFKQYIRNKASKFGIKTFELCESTTGYLWSFIVNTGKQLTTELKQSPGELKSPAVVKKLIGPLLNKGYRLFMDSWFNSPLLARFLKHNGTDCVGTLRPSRSNVPVLIDKAQLKRGEYIARHSGDVAVLAWQDKKKVTMISTCHGSSFALPTSSRPSSRPAPFKPNVVLDYNKFMGGVDLKDQMLEPYLLERKRCRKWYMKLFKRLLNDSIFNARILLQSSTKKHFNHLAFRLSLVDSILSNHLEHCPSNRQRTISSTSSIKPDIYTVFAHWPVLLAPPEDAKPGRATLQKRCVLCFGEGRKTIRTSYCCEFCRVPLCIKNCFKSYHTKRH